MFHWFFIISVKRLLLKTETKHALKVSCSNKSDEAFCFSCFLLFSDCCFCVNAWIPYSGACFFPFLFNQSCYSREMNHWIIKLVSMVQSLWKNILQGHHWLSIHHGRILLVNGMWAINWFMSYSRKLWLLVWRLYCNFMKYFSFSLGFMPLVIRSNFCFLLLNFLLAERKKENMGWEKPGGNC